MKSSVVGVDTTNTTITELLETPLTIDRSKPPIWTYLPNGNVFPDFMCEANVFKNYIPTAVYDNMSALTNAFIEEHYIRVQSPPESKEGPAIFAKYYKLWREAEENGWTTKYSRIYSLPSILVIHGEDGYYEGAREEYRPLKCPLLIHSNAHQTTKRRVFTSDTHAMIRVPDFAAFVNHHSTLVPEDVCKNVYDIAKFLSDSFTADAKQNDKTREYYDMAELLYCAAACKGWVQKNPSPYYIIATEGIWPLREKHCIKITDPWEWDPMPFEPEVISAAAEILYNRYGVELP